MSTRDTPATPAAPVRRSVTAALALPALAHLTVSIDFNIVYIALPEIGAELGFAPGALQWVVNAFALGFGGFLLLGGRAVDRIGARRMLVAGAFLMGAASIAGALAVHPVVLVLARGVQGLGAAALFPATLALINAGFPAGPERNRAMAVWGTAGAFGALAGGAVGGLLTSAFGWTSVFWALVPLTLVIVLGAPRLLPADRWAPSLRNFDALGATLVTGGSLLLVAGVFRSQDSGWAAPDSAGFLALGVAVLGAFLFVEHRSTAPLLPPRLLADRAFLVPVALVFVLMGTVNAMHYVYTTHVQDVLGLSPFAAGLGFLPQGAVAMTGSMLLLPVALDRWGHRRTLFVGTLGVGATAAAFALGLSGDSYWAVLPGLFLLGLSAGTVYPAVFAAAGSGIAEREQGVGSAAVSTAQQIGGAVGLAALVAVADRAGAGAEIGTGTISGLGVASWVGAAVTVTVAFLALVLFRGAPARGASSNSRPAG